MKITYNEYLPLDGAGTMINPAYKWLVTERTETCRNIEKCGYCFYTKDWSGFVIHSIEPEKIKRIEVDSLVIDLKAHPMRYVHFSIFGRKEKK